MANTTELIKKFKQQYFEVFQELEIEEREDDCGEFCVHCGVDDLIYIDDEVFDLSNVIPGAKLVVCADKYNTCYKGKECDFTIHQIWEYEDHYIIYKLSHEDDNDNLLIFKNIVEYFDSLDDFLDKSYTFIPKTEFDHSFLDEINEISVLADFFTDEKSFSRYLKSRSKKHN
jgi:hypothetical protein